MQTYITNFAYWEFPGKLVHFLEKSFNEAILQNRGNFQVILIDNANSSYNPQLVIIDNNEKLQGSAKLLGKKFDIIWKLTQTDPLYVEKPRIS